MAGAGRLAARFPWWVLTAWILAALVAGTTVFLVGAQTDNDLDLPGTDSQTATDVLAARFPPQQNGTSPIVFYVPSGGLLSGDQKTAVHDAVKGMRQTEHVYSVLNPISSKGQAAGLVSADKSTAYAPVLMDIDSGEVDEELAQAVLDAAREPAEAAGVTVEAGGAIGSRLSIPETESSEIVGLAAAMVILTIVLGSLIAMGLPIVVAIVALSVALSLIGLMGHLFGVPSIAPTVATMIGLGVGIDYALFLVTRHQTELAKGVPMHESIAEAVATSGSAIVFAGGTVVVALLCLAVADIPLVTAIGLAAAVAVVVAVLASVTLLPALLSIVGNGIHKLAIPAALRHEASSEASGFWHTWSNAVTTHPWLAIGASLAILAPLIVPVFSLQLGQEDISVAPTSTTERRAYDLVEQGLGVGYNGPLLIASTLHPAARPSQEFQQKYHKAKSLQRQLKKEQKYLRQQKKKLQGQQAQLQAEGDQLQAQADVLKTQQAELLAQQAALQAQANELKTEQGQLEAQQRGLEAEKRSLTNQGLALARQAKRVALALGVVRAREDLLKRRIQHATNPNRIDRLKERLARVQAREDLLLKKAQQIRKQAEHLAAQAERLQRQADHLQAEAASLQQQATALEQSKLALESQAAALTSQADALKAQQADLQRQANQLQRQADALKMQKQRAERQKSKAESLQKQLTRQLTQAGGDKRATDPRIVSLQGTLLGTPGVVALTPPQVSTKGDALVLNAVPATAPASDETAALVVTLRVDVLPQSKSQGLVSHVGGYTASYVDLASKIADRLPIVVLTVLALSFLLLLLAFRSLLIPLQAAVTNLLSVAASFGVLTAVFQWGWGLSLVGLDAPSGSVPIASYVPLMMFAVLFGLSMDYEVFLVSHIIAARERGISARDSVIDGLSGSARVISGAALIMICVFGSFILNGDPTVKQFGVGLSVAVLLAAALVLVLAPALLGLLGRRTWWLPNWLEKILPDLGLRE